MEEFDVSHISLNGYTLIEASAGTGKTFTITSIYLRLVMEEGLSPEQILVVTFTKAATEELRAKLRERLRQALQLLKNDRDYSSVSKDVDSVLQSLLDHALQAGVGKRLIIQRLESAILSMDQASVFTIHSFCQRMLKEFAFEASAPLGQEMIRQESHFIDQAIHDFLRYARHSTENDFVQTILAELFPKDLVAQLSQELLPLIRVPEPFLLEEVNINQVRHELQCFKDALKPVAEFMQEATMALEKLLLCQADGLLSWLDGEIGQKALKRLKTSVKRRIISTVRSASSSVFELEQTLLPKESLFIKVATGPLFYKKGLEKCFFLKQIVEDLVPKDGGKPKQKFLRQEFDSETSLIFWQEAVRWFKEPKYQQDQHELESLERFRQIFSSLLSHKGIRDRAKAAILIEAKGFVKKYLEKSKRKKGWSSYDDMLTRLFNALQGKDGKILGQRMQARYPVALIDEFQDTDALQWGIFKAIYSSPSSSRLFLIGDPKQAIYGFRGADIFTYLTAKKNVDRARRFSLTTNWRSSPALVKTVNTIFSQKGKRAFVIEGIDFFKVKAQQDNYLRFFMDGGPFANIPDDQGSSTEIWLCFNERDEDIASNISCVDLTARQIKYLIDLGAKDVLFLKGPNGKKQKIQPGDITVLVETHYQARQMKEALNELGIGAVYYGPSSVFTTNEARELLYLLNALLNPTDTESVLTALGTTCIGLDARDLYEIKGDAAAWDGLVDTLSSLKMSWQQRGILAAIRELFNQFDIPKRLLGLRDGARRLTNLRQLGELLSKAEEEYPGPEQLFLWLKENMDCPDNDSEEQQLRLETDENLVKVMTYHRSKGLEFPILFLPFIGSLGLDISKGMQKARGRYFSREHHGYVIRMCDRYDSDSQYDCDVIFDEEPLWQRELRSQVEAEYVRLAYVALTRAKYKVYMAFENERQLRCSSLGRLLFNKTIEDTSHNVEDVEKAIEKKLESIFEGLDVDVVDLSRLEKRLFEPEVKATKQLESPPIFTLDSLEGFSVRQVWTQTSFSSLILDRGPINLLNKFTRKMEKSGSDNLDIFSFPTGTVAGNCVHKFFELAPFNGADRELVDVAENVLREFGFDNKWAHVLSHMGRRVFCAELASGIRLMDLSPNWLVREMGFYFPLSKGLISAFPSLQEQCSQGVVKGFIDLLFCHSGRFYVLDYKTNWLGDSIDAYSKQAMEAAMDQHNYWIQAAIYARAVHNYLSSSMVDYNFQKHFGGAFYLFVRGIGKDPVGKSSSNTGILYISPTQILKAIPRLFSDIVKG